MSQNLLVDAVVAQWLMVELAFGCLQGDTTDTYSRNVEPFEGLYG